MCFIVNVLDKFSKENEYDFNLNWCLFNYIYGLINRDNEKDIYN